MEKWNDEGLGLQAADGNEHLNHCLETPGEIRQNLLNRMNRCSILAVRLHSTISHMNRSKVMNAKRLKQTTSIKEDTVFFENIIGITP